MAAEVCSSCKFWLDQGGLFKKEPGDCRRYPPTASETMHANGYPRINYFFPKTEPTDWCGEWQSHKPAEQKRQPGTYVKDVVVHHENIDGIHFEVINSDATKETFRLFWRSKKGIPAYHRLCEDLGISPPDDTRDLVGKHYR